MANKKQKMTAKQLKEREERALERQRKAQEKAARKALYLFQLWDSCFWEVTNIAMSPFRLIIG